MEIYDIESTFILQAFKLVSSEIWKMLRCNIKYAQIFSISTRL